MPPAPPKSPRAKPSGLPLLFLALLATGLVACRRDPPRPWNVLLIVSDTMRADALTCYGGPTRTPNICGLAERGVRFERAYTNAPWTLPSTASLFTSKYASQFAPTVLPNPDLIRIRVPDSEVLLAEALTTRGYDTLSHVENTIAGRPNALQGLVTNLLKGQRGGPLPPELGFDASIHRYRRLVPILRYLSSPGPRPFYGLYWFRDPHAPYSPPDKHSAGLDAIPLPHPLDYYRGLAHGSVPERGERKLRNALPELSAVELALLRDMYHREAESIDERVGNLLRALELSGRKERTIVVFTSDHGEAFGEHGHYLHGEGYHEEVVRVPLIVAGPAVPAGRVVEDPVALVDLMPTLSELLRVAYLVEPQGLSLVPLMRGRRPAELVDRVHYLVNPIREAGTDAAFWGRYKLITAENDRILELYDLEKDPGEKTNLAAQEPSIVARLILALRKIRAENARRQAILEAAEGRVPGAVSAEDEETQRQLKAVGYVD
ncbi:MAG TPA: sulfatase-like hydrolase/transferase [Thermoanaerobaculia bacterium]|nr:sulfatase-like hydrolase/transferase [Thermoanaerobaculia bacterium]